MLNEIIGLAIQTILLIVNLCILIYVIKCNEAINRTLQTNERKSNVAEIQSDFVNDVMTYAESVGIHPQLNTEGPDGLKVGHINYSTGKEYEVAGMILPEAAQSTDDDLYKSCYEEMKEKIDDWIKANPDAIKERDNKEFDNVKSK